MPKDLIHFKVAMMTSKRLAKTRFGTCLDRERPGLLLGAVFHDGLFYAVTGASRPLAPLAHRLHGAHGEDTYDLIRLQAAHAARAERRDLAAALLAGMASHLFTDAVMHPLVWHLSGHYYSDSPDKKTLARQQHRALEALMDMVACPEMLGRPLFSLRRLLRSVGPALFEALPVDGLAKMTRIAPGRVQAGLRSALRVHAGFQAAYSVTPAARLLFALMPVLPSRAREIAALFYAPQLMTQAAALEGVIDYRHPVTGEAASASLRDMMELAADKAAELCRRLESGVFQGAMQPDLPENGPSLDAGLSGVRAGSMRHFADRPFPALP
ncbi:MAG: zinc dependent phospholipase C family protein [Desulfovibrionaceae bacterium]|nr:zinc dependent phospholipase C family protein [Desulfovibrionaceae bacterium]